MEIELKSQKVSLGETCFDPSFETRRTAWCSTMSTLRWHANSVSYADPVTFAACIACNALRWWWALRLLREAQTRLPEKQQRCVLGKPLGIT